MGPWFEGFTFIKDYMRKSGTKTSNLPEMSTQGRLCCLLAMASKLAREASKTLVLSCLLAMASYDSPELLKMVF
jgi:hypothetical protein